jgi:hypothetical protein
MLFTEMTMTTMQKNIALQRQQITVIDFVTLLNENF